MNKIQTGTGRLRRTEAFAQVPDGSGNIDSVIAMWLDRLTESTEISALYDFMKIHKLTARWFPKDPNVTGLFAISAKKSKNVQTAKSNWVNHVETGDSPIKFGNLNKPFTFVFKNPNKEWVEIGEANEDGELEDYNFFWNVRDAPVSTNVGQLLITIDASFK